jgi:hypothetical protein
MHWSSELQQDPKDQEEDNHQFGQEEVPVEIQQEPKDQEEDNH